MMGIDINNMRWANSNGFDRALMLAVGAKHVHQVKASQSCDHAIAGIKQIRY
jgi:hypothetical protein